ncbi:hypothetical protein J4219_04620 [Candidatus Woesearchaeota archaeon]|nr:hypothetical protein [Candidatus Woesearchaeota archaeon]
MFRSIVVWCFLLFLSACTACPQGAVSVNDSSGHRCIAEPSYCVRDVDCGAAKFSCERPCENLPVNAAFFKQAEMKAKTCDLTNASCRLSPEFVLTWCEESQCRARTLYAEDLVVPPVFLNVTRTQAACYEKRKDEFWMRLKVRNVDVLPLENVDAILVGDALSGSKTVPHNFTDGFVLDGPVVFNETRAVSFLVPASVGHPKYLSLMAVRHISLRGVDVGLVTNRVEPVVFNDLKQC